MVKKLQFFAYHYPKSVLLLLLAMTFAVIPLLPQLQFDISAQSLMVKSSEEWQTYQRSLEDFGSDSVVIIVLSDDELFTSTRLKEVKQAANSLRRLDFVKSSSSLFNVPNVKEVDGYVETIPFLQNIPQSEEEIQLIIDDALSNALVGKSLISTDRKTMAINLYIDDSEHYPGRDQEITQAIEDVLAPLKANLDRVYQMSSPYVRDQISRQIQIDQDSILPAALAVLILVLGFSMGRVNCAIVPMSSAAISIVLTLGFMAYMQIPVNVLTSIIPALLIIIGSTEDVHLMAEYHSGIREGNSRDQAVQRLPLNQSTAITLAFLTTFAGFLSITVNDVELLREFGWLVAFGLFINFLVTTLFVPAYLRLFGGTGISMRSRRFLYQRLARGLFTVVIRFKKTTLLLLLLIAGYFAWGAQYLEVNNNTLAYFAEDSEIRQRAEQIHQDLSGMQTFSIVLDSSIEGTFQKVRYLNEVERIQAFIDERGVFDKTFSFADFVKLTHQVMEGASQPQLPLEDEVVSVYMSFVQFEAVSSYVNPDYSSTRILVRHNVGSSGLLQQEFEAIEYFIQNDLKSSLKATLTGESVLNNRAADAMAVGQIQSLILMVVVILLLVSLLFIDLRAGIIALVPNVFPIIVLFGVMGYYHIPLDSGTTMVAVIALGICVDDTIHFLSRYHNFTRGTDDVELALQKTVEHEATPIATTSVALALGFSTLTLSSFQPVVYFGALSALVMVLAMFSTFVLTPTLLSFTRLVTVWDMLSINLKSDVLKNSAIFRGLRSFEIKQAILSGNIRRFEQGDIIIDQGLAGNEFYVLLEGTVKTTHRDPDGSVHTLTTLKAGDLFGEVAYLSERNRMVRVTASEKVQVLEMKWDGIRQLGRFHPRISMRLYRNLAEVLSKRIVILSEEKQNAYDELTGALTKNYLCEFLQQELRRSHHFSESMSLMMLDIEIIPVHDELSQEERDSLVLSITRIIHEFLQPTDIFARWEEASFMLVLPRKNASQTVELGERIQMAIEDADISSEAHLHISASVTEVQATDQGRDAIERLEKQMQKFKQTRRSLRIAVA